ncbi:ecdysone receptor [Pseudomyrmex gracilis]|uniref:ecdysone receptor n=1 Tax=Pseudomyrmex gracilis TaxID=219809 RepID=UPI0009950331|nr:ecdysone receptor [Pseudomyrmex gracilis]XP_020286030.1 ecdysone receptor [Pseudomyrmex gracilis]
MDTSGDSSMDTTNGGTATGGTITSVVAGAASLTLVKAEISTSPLTVPPVAAGPIGGSLFGSITNSNKTARMDDWLATNSPGSPQSSLQGHVIYASQLPEQPPLAHQQQQVSNNGYASPMSTSSYDPYSPNGKVEPTQQVPITSITNGSVNNDGCDTKKRKGPTPRQQEELCLVCGDRASGYHYNALTCEGCKGFFRRSITRNAVYQCKYGNGCEIDMYMRRKCQECRLKKCLAVGMRPECVVPEFQCAVKRKEKKAQKEKDKPNSTTMNGSPSSAGMGDHQMSVKTEPVEPESVSGKRNNSKYSLNSSAASVNPISPEQEELISRLVSFQCEFEQPSEEDMKRINLNSPFAGEDPSDYSFRHITEITILTVQLIVEFSKRLPGFNELMREDQITLLKACSSEVMMLRMARKYDAMSDSIIFANNQSYTRDNYSIAGMGDTIDNLLHFCRQMYAMKVNNAEYALLTAIVIFSERPNLVEGKKVEKLQEIYLKTLKAYVDNHRHEYSSGTIFAKLLSVLTELRTLGNQNSQMCLNLKFKNKKLPVFLAEIWDVIP